MYCNSHSRPIAFFDGIPFPKAGLDAKIYILRKRIIEKEVSFTALHTEMVKSRGKSFSVSEPD